ncbi:general stress protein [Saccharopolyspora gloriosae]|uniref:general stress protein n=1 Tax=Saccharopolyspora gloriosae TaxID=455344 RepID=UPI001FB63C45|nr:general stress protein [Saccharopolyspora gloriosae]
MSSPFSGSARPAPGSPNSMPTPPTGWPIGSYGTYEEAQRAVDHLAGADFPVREVTIVGVDLMLVERITGKLTWGKVVAGGAASGAWIGLLIGLVMSIATPPGTGALSSMLAGLGGGIVIGIGFAAAGYLAMRGRRDFSSASQLVAGRYDVLAQPRNAEHGRNLLAHLAMRPQTSH